MLTIDTIPLRLKIPNSPFQIKNLEFKIWNLEFSIICFLCADDGNGNDCKIYSTPTFPEYFFYFSSLHSCVLCTQCIAKLCYLSA